MHYFSTKQWLSGCRHNASHQAPKPKHALMATVEVLTQVRNVCCIALLVVRSAGRLACYSTF